jgi:hypothetical protein
MSLEDIDKLGLTPYTLQIKHAAPFFGYHPKTLYDKVSSGDLVLGVHYLKVGGKVLIITEAFKKWMFEQSGVIYGGNTNKSV